MSGAHNRGGEREREREREREYGSGPRKKLGPHVDPIVNPVHWVQPIGPIVTKDDNENQAPIFRTGVSCKGKGCNVIIDGGSSMNIISKEAIKKLQLPTTKHPTPYKVAWIYDYSIPIN